MMRCVIIYWSRYGHGKKLVEHLSKILKEDDVKTKIFKPSELEPDNIPKADLYVFSTPTEAFRIKSDMRKFMKKIEGLEGKPYGIINTHSMKRDWLNSMEKILKKKKMKKIAEVDFKIGKVGAEDGDALPFNWKGDLDRFSKELIRT